MPHCLIECPTTLAARVGERVLLTAVHDAIDASGFFKPGDIKVRIAGYGHYRCGAGEDDFVHVTLSVLDGRSVEQRRSLATATIAALVALLPEVKTLSMDVRDMKRAVLFNRSSDEIAG